MQLQNLITLIIAEVAYDVVLIFDLKLLSSQLSATIYDILQTQIWFLSIFWTFAIIIFTSTAYNLLNKSLIN